MLNTLDFTEACLDKSNAAQIVVEMRAQYGETKFYPVCSMARCFAGVAGTKTLTRTALQLIEEQGFAIVVRVGGVETEINWRNLK